MRQRAGADAEVVERKPEAQGLQQGSVHARLELAQNDQAGQRIVSRPR
jgi:hypothetical protein